MPAKKRHCRLDSVARSFLAGECRALKLARTGHAALGNGNAAFKGVGSTTPNFFQGLLVRQYVKITRLLIHGLRINLHIDATVHSGESTEICCATLPLRKMTAYIPVQVHIVSMACTNAN